MPCLPFKPPGPIESPGWSAALLYLLRCVPDSMTRPRGLQVHGTGAQVVLVASMSILTCWPFASDEASWYWAWVAARAISNLSLRPWILSVAIPNLKSVCVLFSLQFIEMFQPRQNDLFTRLLNLAGQKDLV